MGEKRGIKRAASIMARTHYPLMAIVIFIFMGFYKTTEPTMDLRLTTSF